MSTRIASLPGNGVRAVGVVVSVVALAAVGWWAAHQDAPRLPSTRGEVAALVAAVAIYAAATVLRAERWRWLLRDSGAWPHRRDCYGLTVVGYMGNNVLPARAGDALRVYLLPQRARTDMRTVLGTLVAERVLDVAVLFSLFFVLAYGVLHGVDAPDATRFVPLVIAGVALALGAVTALWLARRSERVSRMLTRLRPVLRATARLRRRHGVVLLGITLAIWALEAGTWFEVGRAAGVSMSPLEAIYLVALASLFVFIPAGPGYAGTLDAATIFGVKAIGGTGRAAFSYLLLLRFVLLVPITLCGLAVLLLRYGGMARVRGARRAESAVEPA